MQGEMTIQAIWNCLNIRQSFLEDARKHAPPTNPESPPKEVVVFGRFVSVGHVSLCPWYYAPAFERPLFRDAPKRVHPKILPKQRVFPTEIP